MRERHATQTVLMRTVLLRGWGQSKGKERKGAQSSFVGGRGGAGERGREEETEAERQRNRQRDRKTGRGRLPLQRSGGKKEREWAEPVS